MHRNLTSKFGYDFIIFINISLINLCYFSESKGDSSDGKKSASTRIKLADKLVADGLLTPSMIMQLRSELRRQVI